MLMSPMTLDSSASNWRSWLVEPMRVMVTGAGSGVGQGVMKALRAAAMPVRVISADIAPFNAGLYRAEEGVIIPRVEAPGALDDMIAAIKASEVRAVLIGSEFDVEFFALNKDEIESATGATIIVSTPDAVRIADDKWDTAEFLRAEGLPFPRSAVPDSPAEAGQLAESWGLPVIVKARSGTSSRNVVFANSHSEVEEAWGRIPSPMLQEVIAAPSSELRTEYTCSVFRTASGALLGPFTARRTLKGGTSWIAEVGPFEHLHDLLIKIGEAMDFRASLNIQLMDGAAGPVPFEFNARFSGTTAVRAHFGFNEPEMALRSWVLGEAVGQPEIRHGIAMRYHEEVFIDGATAGRLSPGGVRGVVRPWF
jgi:carbamoyl-phosphate synthase large subunit